jgi:hypothetical protein
VARVYQAMSGRARKHARAPVVTPVATAISPIARAPRRLAAREERGNLFAVFVDHCRRCQWRSGTSLDFLEICGRAAPVFPTADTGDSRIARTSRIRKSRLTTCVITKKPVPALPAHNSRQRAQTSVGARNIIALMRRRNFPTSASAHVASERVSCRRDRAACMIPSGGRTDSLC